MGRDYPNCLVGLGTEGCGESGGGGQTSYLAATQLMAWRTSRW